MPGGDAQPCGVFESADRCRTKQGTLFVLVSDGSIDHLSNVFPAKHSHNLIDPGNLIQDDLALPLGHAASHDHRPHSAQFLEREHFANHPQRFLPSWFDEAASVDDNDICAVGIRLKCIAVLGKLAQHPLGVNSVLRASQADERERFRGLCFGCICQLTGMR